MIKLMGDLVMVKTETENSLRDSGLIIPQLQENPSYVGKVIAKGEGVRYEKLTIENGQVKTTIKKRPMTEFEIGDKVIFPTWAGEKIEIDGEEYLLLREFHILAVVEE